MTKQIKQIQKINLERKIEKIEEMELEIAKKIIEVEQIKINCCTKNYFIKKYLEKLEYEIYRDKKELKQLKIYIKNNEMKGGDYNVKI